MMIPAAVKRTRRRKMSMLMTMMMMMMMMTMTMTMTMTIMMTMTMTMTMVIVTTTSNITVEHSETDSGPNKKARALQPREGLHRKAQLQGIDPTKTVENRNLSLCILSFRVMYLSYLPVPGSVQNTR